jgi:hypothetical protein
MQNSFTLRMLMMVIFVSIGPKTLSAEQSRKIFSYDDYAAVLKDYVDDAGMVNYKQLKANRAKLDAFIDGMAKLDAKAYEKWDEKAKIALWLNAYNAFTLKAIIDNYPIKSSFFKSRVYPKNSIRQISGVWNKITFTVIGQDLTLEHIEHKILREKFDEPRIHMALVCAAIGCPPLRNEPYFAPELDEQLDDQARHFLANPEKFKIDRRKNRLYLSPILKWFADDFINRYGSPKNISEHSKEVSAVLNFIAAYLEKADKDYILRGEFKIKYLKYDWLLNEQQMDSEESKQYEK